MTESAFAEPSCSQEPQSLPPRGGPPTGLFPDPSIQEAGGVQGQSSRSTASGPQGTRGQARLLKSVGQVYGLCSFCPALQR